jgi:serine/alanine adding enzyme
MHAYTIKYASGSDRERWDGYVRGHPHASLYHRYGWRHVIQGSYGHATYYLMLLEGGTGADVAAPRAAEPDPSAPSVLGVLPVAHLKHPVFGNRLVSLPFFDGGGILADHAEAERCLLDEVKRLGRQLAVGRIELRHERAFESGDDQDSTGGDAVGEPQNLVARSDKVRMLLDLPESSDALMKSFKSKLRSQIARPVKEGLNTRTGGAELLGDFYEVFLTNMRDLGSPVHSVELMRLVLDEFPESSRIFVVYKAGIPVAAALTVGIDKVLRNPWASSLRKYASLSPNMLLYLRMLEYACDSGYRIFDFGRSTRGEGTYRFKEQWGAVPAPLYWYQMSPAGIPPDPEGLDEGRFKFASRCWSKLPIVVTRLLGPRIRKHISL